jgi:site-specific DNA-methyltransferase (adenine-specific)
MEVMKNTPDKKYDLAIVDPPYGIGESGATNHTRSKLAKAKDYEPFSGHDTEPPTQEYFNQLRRVSKNQIIFGANHFISLIPHDSPCWIVWDKLNGKSDFADCELAYTSFKKAVRKVSFRWAGMLQGNMREKETRIHPTQKPVSLYRWILRNFANPGDKILDTHLGSGSSAIACFYEGYDFTGFEISDHYYSAAQDRLQRETLQIELDFTTKKDGELNV